jgi:outer membrane lipoprotein carrier protein
MKKNAAILVFCAFALFGARLGPLPFKPGAFEASAAESNLNLEQILNDVESQYDGKGFQADFLQKSTLKAMEITDFASGKVFVRYPGMMRWEYEKPDRQIIITDGLQLWIYRPADNQVMTGGAPVFFRDGKGASFLSDIKLIRQKFNISLLTSAGASHYELQLLPLEKTLDVSDIRLSVTKDTFKVVRIVTHTSSGDENQIELVNYQFNVQMDDALFRFDIPQGADVLQMDE